MVDVPPRNGMLMPNDVHGHFQRLVMGKFWRDARAGCADKKKVIGLYFVAKRDCESFGPNCVCSGQKHAPI